MVKIISHRGILDGKLDSENSPDAIENAIKYGFHVEIDLRLIDGKLYLGHDQPQYEIQYSFLEKHNQKLLIHCKNISALIYMLSYYPTFNFFCNQSDQFTITSNFNILANSVENYTNCTLYLSPELYGHKFTKLPEYIVHNLGGIITDFPLRYEEYLST